MEKRIEGRYLADAKEYDSAVVLRGKDDDDSAALFEADVTQTVKEWAGVYPHVSVVDVNDDATETKPESETPELPING